MCLNFPDYAEKCLKKIEDSGFEAWFVGGCVRDILSGRPFHDIDIATSALPEQIQSIFSRTVPTGIKHGTVTVLCEGRSIEVTTYRTESGYRDSRHPDAVAFNTDIVGDLARRDFTMNAIALHPHRGILDPFGGKEDIRCRIIRCVGDPAKRFAEDALRILRAYRFSSVLNFTIDAATVNAAEICAEAIKRISGERILSELKKLVCGKNPAVFEDVINGGILRFCGIGGITDASHGLSSLTLLKNDPVLRFPVFLALTEHDSVKIKAVLKPDKALLASIERLDAMKKLPLPDSKAAIKRMLSGFGKASVCLYFEYLRTFKDEGIPDCLYEMLEEIETNGEPYRTSDLALDGNMLMQEGFRKCEIGKALHFLTDYVIEHPKANQADLLLKQLKNFNHE